MDVVLVPVVRRVEGDDGLEGGGLQEGQLETIEAAPALAVHSNPTIAPALPGYPVCRRKDRDQNDLLGCRDLTYQVAAVFHFLLEVLVMIDPARVTRPPDVGPDHHEAVTRQPRMSSVVSLRCPVRLPVGEVLQHCRELLGTINTSGTFYQGYAVLLVQQC